MPGLAPAVDNAFAVKGLTGEWRFPDSEYIEVSSLNPPADTSVEAVVPQAVAASVLDWEGTNPMQPAARLFSVGGISAWQQAQVITGLAVGIFGTLLATLLLLGRPAKDATVAAIRKAIQGALDTRAQLATITAERDAAKAEAEKERQLAADRLEDLRRGFEGLSATLKRAEQEESPRSRRHIRPKESK